VYKTNSKFDALFDAAKADETNEIVFGGGYNKESGYFIEPTVILTSNPKYATMETELFGPVITIYVYEDAKWAETLILVDPMLATGQSLVAVLNKILATQQPKEIHIAVVIAAPEGIKYLEENLPENCHLWVASLDEKLNEKNYIIPGLGDAGDLAFGNKL
jgi:hypothetical protein